MNQNLLLNRCIAGLYAPGSTFKLITALYVLENLNFNPKTKYFCEVLLSLVIENFIVGKKEDMAWLI